MSNIHRDKYHSMLDSSHASRHHGINNIPSEVQDISLTEMETMSAAVPSTMTGGNAYDRNFQNIYNQVSRQVYQGGENLGFQLVTELGGKIRSSGKIPGITQQQSNAFASFIFRRAKEELKSDKFTPQVAEVARRYAQNPEKLYQEFQDYVASKPPRVRKPRRTNKRATQTGGFNFDESTSSSTSDDDDEFIYDNNMERQRRSNSGRNQSRAQNQRRTQFDEEFEEEDIDSNDIDSDDLDDGPDFRLNADITRDDRSLDFDDEETYTGGRYNDYGADAYPDEEDDDNWTGGENYKYGNRRPQNTRRQNNGRQNNGRR